MGISRVAAGSVGLSQLPAEWSQVGLALTVPIEDRCHEVSLPRTIAKVIQGQAVSQDWKCPCQILSRCSVIPSILHHRGSGLAYAYEGLVWHEDAISISIIPGKLCFLRGDSNNLISTFNQLLILYTNTVYSRDLDHFLFPTFYILRLKPNLPQVGWTH